MFGLYIARAGIFLQILVLFRGFIAANLRRFPFFYTYIASITAAALIGYHIYATEPNRWGSFFWPAQFITLLVGCGLVLEIFSHVLAAYPGASQFAKRFCYITFGLIFAYALVYIIISGPGSLANSEIALERNVRAAQILLFCVIVGSILHYGLELDQNMRGMMLGYGLYLGTSVVSLALRFYFGEKADVWRTIQPVSFDLSLLIWLIALWNYRPNPAPTRDAGLETDYDVLVGLTRTGVRVLREHLGRSARG
ncbi:MAG TPA: hypothetical protein VJS43_01655 [Candidatus Acidoferrales bacterium]|nr:hypothetical protein [Candidatus Acidoferrales bacterium]